MRATIPITRRPSSSRSRAAAAAAVLMLGALVASSRPSPAQQLDQLPWCARIPIASAGACRPLEIPAPRTTLRLAVAATEAQREHGLMNVRSVPHGQGMLFVFPDGEQTREFWMKDTIAPLDMLFVGTDGTINVVAANVPATKPRTPDDKVARRRGAAQYVIELGAGQAAALGLVPGLRLTIPALRAY